MKGIDQRRLGMAGINDNSGSARARARAGGKRRRRKRGTQCWEDKGAEGLDEIGHVRIIRFSLGRFGPVKHWGVTRGTRLGRRRAQELVRRARPPDACLGKWPKLKAIWAWCRTHPPLVPFFFCRVVVFVRSGRRPTLCWGCIKWSLIDTKICWKRRSHHQEDMLLYYFGLLACFSTESLMKF